MMFDLVLFDFDGTTLNSDKMIVDTFIELYQKYSPSHKIDINHILTFSGPPIKESLAKEFPDENIDDLLSDFVNISTKYYYEDIQTYDGLEDLLIELKKRGIKTGLVTNKARFATELAFDITMIRGYFDYVVTGDDIKQYKPDPEGILKSIEHFNIVDRSRVLYVGDSIYDYLAARNANVKFALVSYSPRKNDLLDKADYLISSLANFFIDVKD